MPITGTPTREMDYTLDLTGNWSTYQTKTSGTPATFSIASGKLTINTVTTDTFNSHTEEESRAMVLWGASVGPSWSGGNVTFPSGTTSGQAGLIFGYKSANDYWVRCYDMDQNIKVYHIVNGTKTLMSQTSQTVSTGSSYTLTVPSTRTWTQFPFNYTFADGYPGGKIGFYSTVAGVTFDTPTALDNPRPFPLFGRWEGTSYTANTSGLVLQNAAAGQQGPIYVQNLRLQKFQATFALLPYAGGGTNQAQFVFNGTDRDDYDYLILTASTGANWPNGAVRVNGANGYPMTAALWGGPGSPTYTPVWYRVQFDGSALLVWEIVAASAPSESDWSNTSIATVVMYSTACRTTGGRSGSATPTAEYLQM